MFGRFIRYWLPVIVLMVLIFGISTGVGSSQHTSRIIRPLLLWLYPNISQETLETVHLCIRKLGHLSGYAFLAVLFWRAIRSEAKIVLKRTLGQQFQLVVMLSMLYACTDEFHQTFVPTREGCVRDVMIDTSGAACGALLFWGGLAWRKRRQGNASN